jgi:hypothetical protein
MTILGKHSLQEAIELLEVKNDQIKQVNAGYTQTAKQVDQQDPTFKADWDKFLENWRAFYARERVILAVKGSTDPSPNSLITAENEYLDILAHLQATPGRFQKGDFPDFVDRLTKAKADFKVANRQFDSLDVDLEVYKKADKTVKTVESSTPWLIGGSMALAAFWIWVNRRR